VEEKSTSDSPFEQFGQGLAECSNGLVTQLGAGVKAEDCIVLLICTNGHLYQFGFASLLSPCFVKGGVVSNVLDATCESGKREIARLLAIYKKHCQALGERLKEAQHVALHQQWKLDRSMYFTKKHEDVVLQFERNNPSSWMRYMSVFRTLWSCEGLREHVVFPLGFETDEKGNLVGVLFDKLDRGWCLGIPRDNSDREVYHAEVVRVLDLVHGVGLVHMDFLPCNIAWKRDQHMIKLKLLDFDTACDIDRPIPGTLLKCRNTESTECVWNSSATHACKMFDTWYCFLLGKIPTEYCVQQSIEQTDTSKLLIEFRKWVSVNKEKLLAEFTQSSPKKKK
jgi:serine/threonine protein kinase